jgi:hypothetical protein
MALSKIAGARSLRVGLALATLFVASVLADRVLGRLGVPASGATEAVGPPHWSTTIEHVEFTYTLRTNDLGIRERDLPLSKPPGTFRIVALGDSMTEGMGVSDAQRWTNGLEELLRADGRPVELVNCAESGTGPLDYARVLAAIGWRYRPDLVLVGLYQNDVADTPPDADPARALTDPRRGLAGVARALWPHALGLLEGRRPPSASAPARDLLRAAFYRRRIQ